MKYKGIMTIRLTAAEIKEVNLAMMSVENMVKSLKHTFIGPIPITNSKKERIGVIGFADGAIIIEFD